MKPIIFARVADMKYYKGITKNDTPSNGGTYVKETNMAHECFNFEAVCMEDGKEKCLGFTQLMGGNKEANIQLHIENIVGCKSFMKEDKIDDVIVVFCSKANNSQNMRVVGFYKCTTVYRNYKVDEVERGYVQTYNFLAEKDNCVLLPYHVRHSKSQWYVPTSGKNGSSFGFGHSNIWYAGSKTKNNKEIEYTERMISSIENFDGENWIDRGGDC